MDVRNSNGPSTATTAPSLGPAGKRVSAAIPFVLLVALIARLWGIDWGLPSSLHYFSYHPDESAVLFNAMNGINVFSGKFLPHFYNYGSLQLYLINFANTIAYLLGSVGKVVPMSMDFRTDYGSWARMTLIARLLAAVMGTWTVGLVYGIGARLWNSAAGLMAAALLAVMPLHVQHSHWLTVDVPATFWIMLSVYWSVRLWQQSGQESETGSQRSGWQAYSPAVWAGVAAGFATATKYNAALVLLTVLHAAWPAKTRTLRKSTALAAAAVASFAVAFLVGCPGCLLDTAQFVHDVGFEARHVSAQADEPFQQTGSGFVYHVTTNLYDGMGWPLLLLTIASIAYALARRSRQDGLLAVFAFPYYALIGFAAVRYARYAIPLLPFLALWCGRMLSDMVSAEWRPARSAGIVLCIIAVIATAQVAVSLISPMRREDPRDRAVAWLDAHGLRNSPVGFATMPWFQTPPVDPAFCWYMRTAWMQLPYNPPNWQSLYLYHGKDWDTSVLDVDKAPVILLSQYDYKDAIRLHRPDALAFLSKLRSDYRVAAEFGGYGHPDIDASGPPHDMLYANPATWVFVRK